MRRKTRAVLITQKNRRISRNAPIAVPHAFPIASALHVVIMAIGQSKHVKNKIVIGVDLMGSDHDPQVLLNALQTLPPQGELLAIGTSKHLVSSFPIHVAPDFIGMEENPLLALRRKKEASLCIGMRLLKEKKIDAFVSAGNTGALVTAAKMILGLSPHVLRPALLALMPTKKEAVAVLDVGANIEAKASHLIQFTFMGSAFLQSRAVPTPSIGLLNIGSEAVKGTKEQRIAYRELQRLSAPPFRFVGNIEGKTVFDGEVNALVSDGFTGNIFLKTAEGIGGFILDQLYSQLPPDALEKLEPKLNDLQRHLHAPEYPGALLVGVRGMVIKCHSYATPRAFADAVRSAMELAANGFMEVFQNKLDQYHLEKVPNPT